MATSKRDRNKQFDIIPVEIVAPTPETIDGLLATDITTGLLKTTILVSKLGEIKQTISMSDIAAWTVTGSRLTIISQDSKQIVLTFTSSAEAQLADARIAGNLNGTIY